MVAFGVLGWTAGLPTAIVTSGAAMAMLGIFVAVRFPEDNFTHVRRRRWATTTLSVLHNGWSLTRHDPQILLMLAAPDAETGGIGRLLAGGVAFSVIRAVSVIWVNRRTASDTRATVHSFLSQAETVGEIAGGLVLAAVASSASMPSAFLAAGALIARTAIPATLPRLTAGTGQARRAGVRG